MKKMLIVMFVVSLAAACGKKQSQPAPAAPTTPTAPAGEGDATKPAGEGGDATKPAGEGGGMEAPK